VGRVEVGRSVNGENIPAADGEAGVLRTSAVLGGRFNALANKRVIAKDRDSVRAQVSAGTVIFNRSNSMTHVGGSALVDRDYPNLYLSDKLWALTPVEDVDAAWLHAALSTENVRAKLRSAASGTSGAMKNISMRSLMALTIPVAPLPEQRKVAAILRTWDQAIASAVSQRESGSSRYLGLVNALTGTRGQLRRLGEVTYELTARNADNQYGRSDVMGVSNKHGIVPMRAQTISSDLSRYQVLPPRTFAYNPMRIDVGSIAMSRLDRPAIVSPDYVLFACEISEMLPEFLEHIIHTRRWRHDVSSGASGSVRTRTYYDDLAAIQVHLPPPEKQARIASALDAVRDEIALLDRQVALLREQKRGLAQKLLSGEIRVDGLSHEGDHDD
jgi:type I restriction enzyme S subunit